MTQSSEPAPNSNPSLRARRVLVTGGCGFLGSHIVERLRLSGYTDIHAPRSREFDLRQSEATSKLFEWTRPALVIHAAAVVGGIAANRDNPGRFFYENAIMGMHVVEACRVFGVEKTVVIGTVCSYPNHTPVPFREQDLWQGYPEETNAPYGIAKRALLVQCQAYRKEYGINAIFLMPSNLYGPRDSFDPRSSHVIPALIRRFVEAQRGGERVVTLWGTGEPTRDFLYVKDAAEAIVAAAEKYDGPEPVNIGSGCEAPIRSVAEMIAQLVGYSGTIRWDASQPSGQQRRRLDIGRAQREFAFEARTSLADGLKTTLEWYENASSLQPSDARRLT
jgi:nucleoside-diphosphate-sugar epimerase